MPGNSVCFGVSVTPVEKNPGRRLKQETNRIASAANDQRVSARLTMFRVLLIKFCVMEIFSSFFGSRDLVFSREGRHV